MTEADLRALVREAVARHLGRGAAPVLPPFDPPAPAVRRASPADVHPSYGKYITVVNVGDECVIEPAVKCNHCGYCKSHGH